VSNGLGVIVEMLVAILLALTIIYCISLNRRLKLLKADEQSLRATISELVTATEIAERAIGGLKLTVHECEAGLGERLRSADRFTADLDRSVAAGQQLLDRLTRIVVAGGNAIAEAQPKAPAPQPPPPGARVARPAPEPPRGAQAVAAAAQAFAERLRVKVHGLAA
jgi:Domain of unknown function (DUF6468)